MDQVLFEMMLTGLDEAIADARARRAPPSPTSPDPLAENLARPRRSAAPRTDIPSETPGVEP